MKAIPFGTTCMVGRGVPRECLLSRSTLNMCGVDGVFRNHVTSPEPMVRHDSTWPGEVPQACAGTAKSTRFVEKKVEIGALC
jgi:hypothetical protein